MPDCTPHVFEIEQDVWNSLSFDEMLATVEGMKEMGIYNLPFETGKIVVRVHHHATKGAKKMITEVTGLREGEAFSEHFILYPNVPKKRLNWYTANKADISQGKSSMLDEGITIEGKEIVHRFRCLFDEDESRKFFSDGLVVLLASKGLEKQSRERKLAKLGIGKKRDEYITTIKLSQSLGSHESVRQGQPVRPHLRRGHIRSQRHGAGNELVKRIWIDPIFVNADENFVSTRKAYMLVH